MLGVGSSVSAILQGDVTFCTVVRNGEFSVQRLITPSDVLLVPELDNNLISCASRDEIHIHGYGVSMDMNFVPEGKVVLRCRMEH